MWQRVLCVGLIASGCTIACGSRSPLDEADSSGSDTDDEVDPAPSAAGGSGSAPSPDDGSSGNAGTRASADPSQDALPECVPGPARAAAEAAGVDCNWVVSDRCYERRIQACACACPRDRDSTCVSGSPGLEVGVACL